MVLQINALYNKVNEMSVLPQIKVHSLFKKCETVQLFIDMKDRNAHLFFCLFFLYLTCLKLLYVAKSFWAYI